MGSSLALAIAFLATSEVGAVSSDSPPTDVDLRATYCLEITDRYIADADTMLASPDYKKGLAAAAQSAEFSYIPAMISAKMSEYKQRRQQLLTFQKSRPPVDRALTEPVKALADADFASQNFRHQLVCEKLTWLQ